MATDLNFYIYRGLQTLKILKWKVKSGSQIFANTVILTYTHVDSDTEIKLKSDVDGTVLALLVKEGDLVHTGDKLLEVQSCTHEVIIKELCAQCGADLRQLSRQNLQEVVASRSFSMVHIVPELKCSLKQAKQLDEADEERLLKARKLILLVDLDQTLIHTTNEDVPVNIKDVYHFQLYGSKSPWYHTRLRPSTRSFLEKISKLYELHIFTFGARMYAHKIANILDPDRKLFSHRILSRDECFDATSKTGNLKAMFPNGDNMVCIIDDREDVWSFTPNIVVVKPYMYFRNTGDINAPPSSSHLCIPESTLKTDTNSTADCKSTENDSNNAEPTSSTVDEETIAVDDNDETTEPLPESNGTKDESPPSTHKALIDKKVVDDDDDGDEDDYLLYLEDILKMIHKAYFNIYDEMSAQGSSTIPDLKNIIPYVRKKVLQGVNIVFSGIIPTNMPPEKSLLWVLAKSFGASVSTDLVFDSDAHRTTHIIATKMGTAKLNKARRASDLHIVTPHWLICCAMRWERADERLFLLKKGATFVPEIVRKYKKVPKGKGSDKKGESAEGFQNSAKRRKGNNGENDNQCSLDITSEELEDMGKEVEEVCGESDSDSENTEQYKDTESNSEYVRYSEEMQSNREMEGSSEHPIEICDLISSSDSSSVCSEDEELADAVMNRLMNSSSPDSNS